MMQTDDIVFDPAGFEKALALVKSLDNRNRLMILCMLCYGDHKVGDLAAAAGLSMSAMSQHLGVLKDAGLVEAEKTSQTVTYRLKDGNVRRVIDLLKDIYCHG